MRTIGWASLVLASLAGSVSLLASAAVSEQEAAQLKGTLTPMGAERAGNKDGSIPEWSGGLQSGGSDSGPPPSLFADEKPLATITAANADQYADKLSEGQLYMLKRVAGYKIVVYPSHRTFAAPQYIYDRTVRNATQMKLSGRELTGDYKGGVPFPIPKSGLEAIFDTQYAWRGIDRTYEHQVWVISSDGKRSLATAGKSTESWPANYPAGRKDDDKGAFRYKVLVETTEPAYQAGEKILGLIPTQLKDDPVAWTYLTGQRRLRKTPNVQYDVPSPFTSGVTNYDDQDGFQGAEDRYDWKVIGKKEMYVPYNNNNFTQAKDLDKVMGPKYVNPDLVRNELHRVWVLDGTLKAGERHVVPHRRLYVDEDSWLIMQADEWDAKGQFWKDVQLLTYVMPSVPAIFTGTNVIYNVQSQAYTVFNIPNSYTAYSYKPVVANTFSASALENSGVR